MSYEKVKRYKEDPHGNITREFAEWYLKKHVVPNIPLKIKGFHKRNLEVVSSKFFFTAKSIGYEFVTKKKDVCWPDPEAIPVKEIIWVKNDTNRIRGAIGEWKQECNEQRKALQSWQGQTLDELFLPDVP